MPRGLPELHMVLFTEALTQRGTVNGGKKGGYLVKLGVTGAKVRRFLTGVHVSA